MYAYMTGKVAKVDSSYLVLENGGIGYKLFADNYTLQNVKKDAETKLYTYLKVAEDEMSLYGFISEEQRVMFEKLISVNGVGPKAALGVLSVMKAGDITAAVVAGDEKSFTRAPGIGKKTAQRIVMELKEKVELSFGDSAAGTDFAAAAAGGAAGEACEALIGLGYTAQEALRAVNSVRHLGDSPEELVALALKRMGK